jgi:hypothetical protein
MQNNLLVWKAAFLAVFCAIGLVSRTAGADEVVNETVVVKIPGLSEVPTSLSTDQQVNFNHQREGLQAQLATLKAGYDHYNSEENQDAGDLSALGTQRTAYIAAANAFNQTLAVEVAAEVQNASVTPDPQSPTAMDLARDPELAALASAQLELVNGRLARIDQAIKILGDSNPEWHKEWAQLREEQIEATHKLAWNCLDLATAGLAKSYELATESQLKEAEEVFQGDSFESLMKWKQSILDGQKRLGFSLTVWDSELEDLGRLEEAVHNHNVVEAVVDLRNAVFAGKEAFEKAEKAGFTTEEKARLFQGSLALSRVALSLTGGIAAKVAEPIDAALKLTEAGLSLKLIREEHQQFGALSDQAYARDKKKLELLKTQGELQTQRASLNMVIQRSKGF